MIYSLVCRPGAKSIGTASMSTSRTGSHTTRHFQVPAAPGELFGLDNFALASFGVRYGVTDKLSVSAFRSPSISRQADSAHGRV